MHTVDVEFARLCSVSADYLIDAVGVYVIWDGRSKQRSTYIGEGNILKRIADHAARFAQPFDGYVAVTGFPSDRAAKFDAEIVEALLLAIAEDTDRRPTENIANGKVARIASLFDDHGVLKMRVRGCDPLLRPGQGYNICSKSASVRVQKRDGSLCLDHDWRARRRSAA